jgi:hypothetical protein
MKKSSGGSSSPIGRCFAGFAIAAGFTFLGVLFSTRGHDIRGDLVTACIAAPMVGFVVGILSLFGKRILQFFMAFFTQMPL